MFPLPPFPLKRESTASAPRGATLGTHIEECRSLIMSLRLRGGYATECHAFSYCAHKAHTRRKQANLCRSCKDESAVFVVWEEEHKEPKRTTATSCGWSNGACVRRVRRSLRSSPCDSNSVFEVAHSVYKNTQTNFSFRCGQSPPTIINYSLLIIN